MAAALLLGAGWTWLTRSVVVPAELALVGAYLAIWIPLLGAVAVAVARGGGSPVRDLGLRIAWIDVLWGLGVGLVARGATSLVELGVFGRTSGSGLVFETSWFAAVFGLVFATVLAGPFVEELFFRGLVLCAVERGSVERGAVERGADAGSRRLAPKLVALLVSTVLFSLLHLADAGANSWAAAGVTLASTLILGAVAGAVTLATGRLGAAMVGHAVYNGVLVWLLLAR